MCKKRDGDNPQEVPNSNEIECRYDGCRKWFVPDRSDQFFHSEKCYLLHKAAVLRAKNKLIKETVDLMLNNEKILRKLYESGTLEITEFDLFKAGFNRQAPSLQMIDEGYGLITLKYFQYGVQLIGKSLYRIVYFVGSILKP